MLHAGIRLRVGLHFRVKELRTKQRKMREWRLRKVKMFSFLCTSAVTCNPRVEPFAISFHARACCYSAYVSYVSVTYAAPAILEVVVALQSYAGT